MRQHVVSTKTLVKSTIAATIIAAAVFVCFILPAEYNIDPTGLGEKLGLTVLAPNSELAASSNVTAQPEGGGRSDEVTITVPAKSGLEYKFQLAQYEKLRYEWSSGERELYFDMHGEPEGGEPGYFESYAEATAAEMKGALTAPFTGSHGWYWRNRGEEEVVITLKTSGNYEVLGLN